MRGLAGQVALVTGGGGTIGAAVCLRLAEEGCVVAILDRNRDAAEQVEEQVVQRGGRAHSYPVDITQYERCRGVVDKVADQLGGVDVLVNCAGYDRCIAFLESDPGFWDPILDINLRGPMNVLHAVLPHMLRRRHGRIVMLTADAARIGSLGQGVFAAASAGVVALSKTLAREHADVPITVNVVSSGPVEGPQLESLKDSELGTQIYRRLQAVIPLRRPGRPEDIVGAIAFLASDEAAYITGQVLSVSGGLTMVG